MKITFWQKLSLVFWGIMLAAIALEIGLRLGGGALTYLQEYRNRCSLRQKGAYRIMCIGESTTQGQYPAFLEQILNSSGTGIQFSVIDKGIIAATTSMIVTQLEEDITTYRPDMVIAMLGVNDGGHTCLPNMRIPRHIAVLKLFKLGQYIFPQFQHKTSTIDRRACFPPPATAAATTAEDFVQFGSNALARKGNGQRGIDGEMRIQDSHHLIEQGKVLTAQGHLESAKQAFTKAIECVPSPHENLEAYFRLLWLVDEQSERKAILETVFQDYRRLIETNGYEVVPDLEIFCTVFVDNPETQQYVPELEPLLRKMIARSETGGAMLGLCYLLLKQERFEEAEQVLKTYGKLYPQPDAKVFDYWAIVYQNTGRAIEADHCFREANKLRSVYSYSALTVSNYRKIKSILDAHKIKFVCVQYPLRRVEDVKRIFGAGDEIIFVDNERCFKRALKHTAYHDLFRDRFAGDFGHCTDNGNKLLAGNIATVILGKVFGTRRIQAPPLVSWGIPRVENGQ